MRSFFSAILIVSALLSGRMMTAQVAAVRFTVIVPEYSNQKNMTVYLAGSFNGWSAHDSLYIMNKETENSYSLTVPLFEGKNYNYKYTLGNWNTVETKLNDSNIANRKLYSKNGLSLYDTVLKWKASPKATTPSPQMQKLAAVKDSAAKQLKLVLNDLLVLLKEYNQNMLSQKPNERLHKKQKKQTVEIFAKLYNTIEAKIWEIGTSLSTEQKQKILAAIRSSGESKDVINTIADAYSSVLK